MKAQALVAELNAVTERIVARSEQFSDAQWNSLCDEDGRTIGQVIGHIADVVGVIHQIAGGIVQQVSYPVLSPDWINARNKERAILAGRLSKEETLMDLKRATSTLAAFIRDLSDDQLGMAGVVFEESDLWTVEQVFSFLLVSHITRHFDEVERSPSDLTART